METPLPSKTPRRKLKRIIAGKNKLSQKKLKTAINVSMNTSHNVRTLRMNNRSLARRLEALKKEYRGAFDAYQSIQEENHSLRQKVVSLECIISDPDSYIEEQVKRKFEAHVREFKKMIQVLHASVEGMSENLKNLDEMCVTFDSPTTKLSQRCYSMDGIVSREPPSLPSPSSLRFQNDLTIGSMSESHTRMEDEMNLASHSIDLNSPEASSETNEERPPNDHPETNKQKDMSLILEQSVVLVKSPLKNTERNIQPERGTVNSKLPRRVLTRSRGRRVEEPDVETTESSTKAVRKSRRATRILSDDEVNVLGILDIEPPSDLLFSPKIPSSSGDNGEQRKDVDEGLSEDGHFKEPPVTTCHNGNAQTKNKKSNVALQKKVNNVQRQAPVKQGKGSDGLFISNEFALINAHEQILKKLQATDTVMSEGTRCTDDRDNEEHTVHMVEDMDLTLPINVDINIPNGSENHFSNTKGELSNAESSSSEISNFEEFCPEAVTLQRTKPGQFKFAASRKETDGRRKSLLSQPPRARSKSKKVIAQMIENLPQEEPKSIFDFHDKTPTQISVKEKEMSVYSLRDESSDTSPPTPLGRAKSKSRVQGEKCSESNALSGQEHSVQGNSQISLKNYIEGSNEVSVRNSKSRSRRKNHEATSQVEGEGCLDEKQPHTIENLSNDKNVGKDSEVSSVLGEGITYSVPLKDDSNTIEKVTTRKSRGRSRSRTKSSARDLVEASNDEENPSIQPDKISTLVNRLTNCSPVKDDSSKAGKITVRNSRSKSRGRMSRARSQSRTKSLANGEKTADSEETVDNTDENVLQSQRSSRFEEGRVTQDIPAKDGTVNAEMVTVRKSRGQSNEQYETSICKQPLADSQSVLSNQANIERPPKEMSALGEGITYSVPLKDDSDVVEKVTVRKSRGRSRTRGNKDAAHEPEAANSHSTARSRSRRRQNVQDDDEACETVSHDVGRKSRGKSRTRDIVKGSEKPEKDQTTIEGESMPSDEKANVTDLHEKRHDENLHQQEMVTVRKSRGQSKERCETFMFQQHLADSEEVSSNQANSNTLPKEMSVLGEGITYSIPLKDDSDQAEMVTVTKSRGRSRTRGNEDAAHDPEIANSHHRIRSRSRRRQNVQDEDEACETVSHDIGRKSRGKSRTRDKIKGSEKPEKDQTTVEGEGTSNNGRTNATDISEKRDETNLHPQKTMKSKPHNKTSGKVIEGAQNEELSERTDKDMITIDSGLTETECRKRKSPPKSHKKKMPKSSKKMKKCDVKSASASPSSQKKSESPVRNSCTETSQKLLAESTSRPISPQVKHSTKVDGSMVDKPEANEKFGDGVGEPNLESIADSQQIKTSESLRRNKKAREQNSEVGKVVSDFQEKFQMQMERLKNLFTPESFKRGKESPLSMNRQSVLSLSPSNSSGRGSTTKETNLDRESSDEPLKRRRAASKCANYAEPSLGGKLRRGDPFTSIGPGKVPIYKSPKANKKIKVKRDILGPLQNHFVEEESN